MKRLEVRDFVNGIILCGVFLALGQRYGSGDQKLINNSMWSIFRMRGLSKMQSAICETDR